VIAGWFALMILATGAQVGRWLCIPAVDIAVVKAAGMVGLHPMEVRK
jgi:hypothetical protein